MSIFRNTFTKEVQGQLTARQRSLIGNNRTPQTLIYLNSRNSWVRMTSSVNVDGDKGKLAKQYVLKGGVIGPKIGDKEIIRAGVGDQYSVYDYNSPSGKSYNPSGIKAGTAGLKPIPGITSVDIKSKSAYGSLREANVNFICYNLQQLEELELLYMRPGYTVLVEWGWIPYLDNIGQPQNNISFYEGVLDGGVERDEVFKALFQKSKDHYGNYDAIFGYIKNYSWTARMDGGYDCIATIVSIGEILESLKVGYIPLDIEGIVNQGGILKNPKILSPTQPSPATTTTPNTSVSNIAKLSGINPYIPGQKAPPLNPSLAFSNNPLAKDYSKNILAGLLRELYEFCANDLKNNTYPAVAFNPTISSTSFKPPYYLFAHYYKTNTVQEGLSTYPDIQAYISLESFIKMLNDYVLLSAGGKPFIALSTKSLTYDDNKEENLLCLAHPLQVSIDPTTCLITSPIWAGGVNTSDLNKGENDITKYDGPARKFLNILKATNDFTTDPKTIIDALLTAIEYGVLEYSSTNAEQFSKAFYKAVLADGGKAADARNYMNSFKIAAKPAVGGATYDALFDLSNDTYYNYDVEIKQKADDAKKLASGNTSNYGVTYLKNFQNIAQNFRYNNDVVTELGIIGNIYLNINKLYLIATDPNSINKNQELNLFDYLKKVLAEVQGCTGGVNNFEIHVDPVDSIARIIDINYIDILKRSDAYKNAFQIEMHNQQGTIRSYNMQSQIFPEQASLVAIGAQVGGGGAQASQNNTLLDFNNNLEDRIIPKKVTPGGDSINELAKDQIIKKLSTNLNKIKDFFALTNVPSTEVIAGENQTNNQSLTAEYKGALKDIITYFQGVTASDTKNRAIIPIKMSLTMDGIGGLIIGHLFKIPPDLLPKGYKLDTIGNKLLQTVTGISHKVGNGEWLTTIDAYNIVISDPKGDIPFSDLIKLDSSTGEYKLNITAASTKDFSNTGVAVKFFSTKYSKDYQVAAIVGALLQESGLRPGDSTTDNTGTAYGIASWRGPRLKKLQQRANFNTLEVQLAYVYEELTTGDESKSGSKLSSSNSLEEAVAAMAGYERFKGITKGANTTYADVLNADPREVGKRIGYAQDILNRIKSGELS
jgi:hypothetical protein